jgi:hypothetical protein
MTVIKYLKDQPKGGRIWFAHGFRGFRPSWCGKCGRAQRLKKWKPGSRERMLILGDFSFFPSVPAIFRVNLHPFIILSGNPSLIPPEVCFTNLPGASPSKFIIKCSHHRPCPPNYPIFQDFSMEIVIKYSLRSVLKTDFV